MIEESYLAFWREHFPPKYGREHALQYTGRAQKMPHEEMVSYQDRVAEVYGDYEVEVFQQATIRHLLKNWPHGERKTLLSLGSGPGTYELWLLAQRKVEQCILVDISPAMLSRAERLASTLGLSERIRCICTEVEALTLPSESADIVLSINALHWSAGWRQWMKIAANLLRPEGAVFLSSTFKHPQSEIEETQFVGVAQRHFKRKDAGYLVPASIREGMLYQPLRYYFSGEKLRKKRR